MNNADLFRIFGTASILVFIIGIYCLLITSSLIRLLIGLEIISKALTLLLTMAGHLTGNTGLAQAFVITLIVIEVFVIIVAAGLVLAVFRKNSSADVKILRHLKG